MIMTDSEFRRVYSFFAKLKVLYGPEFVNATLLRHKKLNLALQDYAKTYIIDLESSLFDKKE